MFIFNSLWQMIVFGVKSFLINPLLYYGNGIYGRTSSYFMNVPKIPEVNLALLIVNYLYVPKFRLMLGRGPVNLSIFMNNFFFVWYLSVINLWWQNIGPTTEILCVSSCSSGGGEWSGMGEEMFVPKQWYFRNIWTKPLTSSP